MLYLGTMFAPIEDRDAPGEGFTHKLGDVVTIASPQPRAAGERHGACRRRRAVDLRRGALMRNLAKRGLL